MGGRSLDDAARRVLDDIFDKWSLLVLDELCRGPARFNDLRRALAPITSKSLTATLRRLADNGIVTRRVVPASPVAVEYAITPLGRSLEEPLGAVLAWVTDHAARGAAVSADAGGTDGAVSTR